MKPTLLFFLAAFLLCCTSPLTTPGEVNDDLIRPGGKNILDRIDVPSGFTRDTEDSASFTHYLRTLSLKPDGSTVKLFNGNDKPWQNVHVAVVDMEIGNKDLQQCADACIRLRAEYLWNSKQFEKIHFNLTNGFRMDYSKWREGNRLKVSGNNTSWVMSAKPSSSHETFRKYLDVVFMYAGTLSVEKELQPVELKDMRAGDIFVVGGSPGHAVTVIDVATNEKGEKIFLLAQGYMPAQEIHIIKNPMDADLSPCFSAQLDNGLETMEWTFTDYTLGRFE